MAIRYTPLFDDGQGPLSCGTFDTPGEAAQYGQEMATAELPYLGFGRHIGHGDLMSLAAQRTLGAQAVEHQHRRPGRITRWDQGATHGFLTDQDGRSWFVSRSDIGDLDSLPPTTLVTFTGASHPAPGKKYPQARLVQVDRGDV